MANFTVADRTPPRFPGDFQITPVSGYTPNNDEAAFLENLGKALDSLARNVSAETAQKMSPTLRGARDAWRSTTVSKLRALAVEFDANQIAANAASEQLGVIETRRVATTPEILIENAKDADARFQGDFAVSCVAFTPDARDDEFLRRLREMVDYLAEQQAADVKAKLSDGRLAARREIRKKAADDLKTNANWWKGGTDPTWVANNVLVVRGAYRALRDRMDRPLFAVRLVYGEGEEKDYAVDLEIEVAEGLPPPNDVASPEKQDLFVQLGNASSVVRKVCQQIRERATRPEEAEVAKKRARLLLDEYVRKLSGIARLGLEGPHTVLARLDLTNLKGEFVAHEAGRIKNRYVRGLGEWAGIFVCGFLFVYLMIRVNECTGGAKCVASWWDNHKMFLLAAAGAAIGTWISFFIRRLDLPFEELALLEEESLAPPFRILFVTALTTIVCLLFWNGAINIEIGNLKTNSDYFKSNGTIAILIGVFCGLSERALATAVSGRASAFVRGVGGGG